MLLWRPARHMSGLKLYMHWDMEGASGVSTREQAWHWEPGARKEVVLDARRLLTESVNAASAAALALSARGSMRPNTTSGSITALE